MSLETNPLSPSENTLNEEVIIYRDQPHPLELIDMYLKPEYRTIINIHDSKLSRQSTENIPDSEKNALSQDLLCFYSQQQQPEDSSQLETIIREQSISLLHRHFPCKDYKSVDRDSLRWYEGLSLALCLNPDNMKRMLHYHEISNSSHHWDHSLNALRAMPEFYLKDKVPIENSEDFIYQGLPISYNDVDISALTIASYREVNPQLLLLEDGDGNPMCMLHLQ